MKKLSVIALVLMLGLSTFLGGCSSSSSSSSSANDDSLICNGQRGINSRT